MKRHTIITIIICACILAASGFLYLRTGTDASGKAQEWASGWVSESPPSASETSASEKKETGIGECTVYICGAVKHPGVYRLHGDARVCDAVDAAGGLSRKADASAVNQARLLTDGEQITIPRKGKKSSTAFRSFCARICATGTPRALPQWQSCWKPAAAPRMPRRARCGFLPRPAGRRRPVPLPVPSGG